MKAKEKHFTLSQVNQMLPLIRNILTDIIDRGRNLRDIIKDQNETTIQPEFFALQEEIDRLICELEELGCIYKDLDFKYGLIDFPGEIEGREVFLSWRGDEKEVQWYHEIEDEFYKRKPIPLELRN